MTSALERTTAAVSGMHVRILVKGKDTHSLEGTVISSRASEIAIAISPSGRIVRFPAQAVASLEVEVDGDRSTTWVTARMPRPVTEITSSVSRLFATGSGAVVRQLNGQMLESALHDLSLAKVELTCYANVALIEELERRVTLALKCLDSAPQYDESAWVRRELLSLGEKVPEQVEDESVSPQLVEVFHDVAHRLAVAIDDYWREYESRVSPRPTIVVKDIETVVSLTPSLEVELPIKISLASTFAPAHQVRLVMPENRDFQTVGAEPSLALLKSGATEKLVARIVVPDRFLERPTPLTVKAQLKYLTQNRRELSTPFQVLRFTLNPPEQFETLENPFAPYAGGTTVSDPDMFFGRAPLLDEITAAMAKGPLGQCYALYGQKRSGKSSFLEQLEVRLARPVIPVVISFGTIDRDELTASVAREVLQQVRVAVISHLTAADARKMSFLWPEDAAISKRPLESLKAGLIGCRQLLAKYPGWASLRYVLLVDEFTYLFEVLRRSTSGPQELADVRDFMRQWKALLDTQAFSAVVVGQDTMPYAMSKFANEFSNMTTKRLSYLERAETNELADRPIRRPDEGSRYIGYSLDRIYEYTDGHPFFTQIVCDRIVRLANRRQRGTISEGDVDEAVESLIDGPSAIERYRFDCFLSADNTGLPVDVLSDDYSAIGDLFDDEGARTFQLLRRLAELSGPQNRPVSIEQLSPYPEEEPILQDLLTREVLSREGAEYVKVRVLLFAEYLRRMS